MLVIAEVLRELLEAVVARARSCEPASFPEGTQGLFGVAGSDPGFIGLTGRLTVLLVRTTWTWRKSLDSC